MSELRPDNDMQAVEKAMRHLLPNPGNLDRDRLMFEAGRESVRPSKTWPIAALISSSLAAALAVVMLYRPSPEPIVQIVHVPAAKSEEPTVHEPAPLPHAEASPAVDHAEQEHTHSYARLQDHLLRFGLDLPAQPPLPEAESPPTSEIRLQRGVIGSFSLFPSWLLSRGSNP